MPQTPTLAFPEFPKPLLPFAIPLRYYKTYSAINKCALHLVSHGHGVFWFFQFQKVEKKNTHI